MDLLKTNLVQEAEENEEAETYLQSSAKLGFFRVMFTANYRSMFYLSENNSIQKAYEKMRNPMEKIFTKVTSVTNL